MWATRAAKQHARIYNLVFPAIGGDIVDLVWMPAHKGDEQVGVAIKGDGQPMTLSDVLGNRLADWHAKEAVKQHRVPKEFTSYYRELEGEASTMAIWTG